MMQEITTTVPVIPYPDPDKPSEFDIQADLYGKLKELGHDVHGSVLARCVVFFATKPVLIIECKNRPHNSPKTGIGGRQKRRYSQFNLPLLVCDRRAHIESVVARVRDVVSSFAFTVCQTGL